MLADHQILPPNKQSNPTRIAYLRNRIAELQSGKPQWYSNHDNVLNLATHLVDECELHTPEMVLRFFEKPWKWNSEWEAFANGMAQSATENDCD